MPKTFTKDKQSKKRPRILSRGSVRYNSSFLSESKRSLTDILNKQIEIRGRSGVYTGSVDIGFSSNDLEDLLPHGRGTMHYEDGSIYTGGWFNRDWSGFGEYYSFPTKGCYQGTFLDNRRNGLFVVKYDDGREFDGVFEMGIMRKGIMKYPEIGTYWGYFDETERPHGRGKFVFNIGQTYDGEWSHGNIDGHGRMIYGKDNESTYYLGNFCDGEKFGKGVLVVEDTIFHDGIWYEDKPIEQPPRVHGTLRHQNESIDHCQRLLVSIPRNLSPCSRFKPTKKPTKNKDKSRTTTSASPFRSQ
jgi:hypothetical protein